MKRVAAAITGCLLALAPVAEGSVLDDACGLCGFMGDGDDGQGGHTASDAAAGATPSHEQTLREKLRNPPPGGWILISDLEPGHWHHDSVKEQVDEQLAVLGLEGDRIVSDPKLFDLGAHWWERFFDSDGVYAGRLAGIRVVNMSWSDTFVAYQTEELVAEHNVLFVTGTGNTPVFPEGHSQAGWPDPSMRDLYTPEAAEEAQYFSVHSYRKTMAVLETGKALLATWANVDSAGTHVPYDFAVRCGDAKKSCFAMELPPEWRSHPLIGTSLAAPRLSAAVYYLSQMHSEATEVVSALRGCTQDIGEPGVDDEFGQGLVNVADCDLEREEKQVVDNGTETEPTSTLIDMFAGGATANASLRGFGLSVPLRSGKGGLPLGITPSVRVSSQYRAFTLSAPWAGGQALLAVGHGSAPLGVSSALLPTSKTSFLEIGMTRPVFRARGSSVSLLGAHGIGANFSVTRFGVRLKSENRPVSLYVGAAQMSGAVGIPGHAMVGRPAVSVRRLSPEIRFGCDLPLPESRRAQ